MILLLTGVQPCQLNENNLTHEVCINNDYVHWITIPSVSEKLHGQTDVGKVINYIRQAPDGFFLYLSHLYKRDDTQHSYYNLKFVFFFHYRFLISKT